MSSEYEMAKRALFVMEAKVRRMKYMIELGYFCNEYSEEEWEKFRKVEVKLRNQHPDTDYHIKT